jgi:hypothetical protein
MTWLILSHTSSSAVAFPAQASHTHDICPACKSTQHLKSFTISLGIVTYIFCVSWWILSHTSSSAVAFPAQASPTTSALPANNNYTFPVRRPGVHLDHLRHLPCLQRRSALKMLQIFFFKPSQICSVFLKSRAISFVTLTDMFSLSEISSTFLCYPHRYLLSFLKSR